MFHTLPEALRAGGHPPVPLFVPLIFATLLATFKLPKWKETTFFVLQVTELFKPMDRNAVSQNHPQSTLNGY